MLSFGALNAQSSDDTSFCIFHEVQKEEQEAAALLIYNEAITHEKNNNRELAIKKLEEVLKSDLIKQAPELLQNGEILNDHPALFLKYNVLKKLAYHQEQIETNEGKAVEYYLEAAVIDESDITLWCKVGSLCMKTLNLRLARFAFEKGLIYSHNHWPCLDKLITVLYIIGDYAACLEMISNAFELNGQYIKGFAFRNQIFKEEPHFKKDFIKSSSLFTEDDEEEENTSQYQKYVEEALVMRGKRQLLAKREEFSAIKVSKTLTFYSWSNLGKILLQVYSDIFDADEYQPLSISLDLSRYAKTTEQQANLPILSPENLAKKYKSASKEGGDGTKSLKRKKLNLQNKDEPQPKRRSTRVKLSRTKENDVNWNELIYSFLPEDFKIMQTQSIIDTDSQDSQESMQVEEVEKYTTQSSSQTEVQEIKKESIDVSNFINSHTKKSNCITLMGEFLFALAKSWECEWRRGTYAVYLQVFKKYRKHTFLPNVLCPEVDQKYLALLGKVILIALEFQLDAWAQHRNCTIASPSGQSTPSSNSTNATVGKKEALEFLADLHYISMLAANNEELMDDKLRKFSIRFYWLHGRFCKMSDDKLNAVNSMYNCIDCLESSDIQCIKLHNCHAENIISKETAEKIIDSLQKSQTLDELKDIFEKKDYNKIVSLLEDCVLSEPSKGSSPVSQSQRASQLYMLTEAFYHTKKYKKCLLCITLTLKESVGPSVVPEHWKTYLNDILKRLDSFFTEKELKRFITVDKLPTFCDQLVKLLEATMDSDQPDISVTTLPWLLIYRILKWKEDDIQKVGADDGMETNIVVVDREEYSSSNDLTVGKTKLDFLRSAHEYLGKRHWCCRDDGVVLQVFLKDLMEDLHNVNSQTQRETVKRDIEQCFFCLYGNPCKKTKTKILIDHNVQPIPLSWHNALPLYDFYKPEQLPLLNVKTHTITVEVQHVLRKIVTVIPQKDVEVIPFEKLQLYIEGGENFPDISTEFKESNMEDLFYYLGDFYFKNKEFNKALKFYMHDVCVKPRRFQSWAAMAFTRGSRLEEKLNQCEFKNDGIVKKLITSTLRCFEKAVEINKEKCLVFEEYGQTTYMLNSYASRKLKEALKEDRVDHTSCEQYARMQKEMLLLSEQCFTSALQTANEKEGEKWLHFYMLGKCAEKLEKSPTLFLDYYQKSLHELYQAGGHFIKKITYRSPPEYSIEAVELFYRIHASILNILKYCEKPEYDVLMKHLERAEVQEIYVEIIETDRLSMKENESSSKSSKEKKDAKESNITEIISSMLDEMLTQISLDGNTNVIDQSKQFIKDDSQTSDEVIIKNILEELLEKVESGEDKIKTIEKNEKHSEMVLVTDQTFKNEISTIKAHELQEQVGEENDNCKVSSHRGISNISPEISENKGNRKGDKTITKNLNENLIDMKEKPIFCHNSNDDRSLLNITKISNSKIFSLSNIDNSFDSKVEEFSNLNKVTGSKHQKEFIEEHTEKCHVDVTVKNVLDIILENVVLNVQCSIPTSPDISILERDDTEQRLSQNTCIDLVNSLSEEVIVDINDSRKSKNPENFLKTLDQKGDSLLQEVRQCLNELVARVCKSYDEKSHVRNSSTNHKQMSNLFSDANSMAIEKRWLRRKCGILDRCFESAEEEGMYRRIAKKCLEAFGFCLRRFHEHYKSQYTMAYFFAHSSLFKDLRWSRDLLLGNNMVDQAAYSIPLPSHGIFSGKKKTNLFQYMWRIPVNEIDRAGSFCTHNHRSMNLLLGVLHQLNDHALLIQVSAFLHKTPDKERKYLRDNHRAYLAIKAFEFVLDILRKNMEMASNKADAEKLVMDVYEAYKHAQKLQLSQQTTEYYLVKVYSKLKQYETVIDVERTISLESTLKYCQNFNKPITVRNAEIFN